MWAQGPSGEQVSRSSRVLGIVGSDSVPHGVIDRIAIKIEQLEDRIKELEKKL